MTTVSHADGEVNVVDGESEFDGTVVDVSTFSIETTSAVTDAIGEPAGVAVPLKINLFAGVYEDARIVPDAMVPSSRFVFLSPLISCGPIEIVGLLPLDCTTNT